ncbi:MAG TPA: hypothetical protein VIV11_35780, partial [Kofleriaceae bacterium]
LIQKRGAAEARRDLTIRVLDAPRDVQARLALAELADKTGRPSEAIEQLEAVLKLGGPLGTRWHDEDRARYARLVLARGRARLARSAATALADLERAGTFGAAATKDEIVQARIAIAVTQLRHTDAKERAKGRATLAGFAKPPRAGSELSDEESWTGAKPDAAPTARAAYGVWAWSVGARREAYDQLAAWHAATKVPRDEKLQGAYLRAVAWWSPVWLGEVKPPHAEDLVGPERCWFPGTECTPPVPEEVTLPPAPVIDAEPRAAVAARYAASRATSLDTAAGATASTGALGSDRAGIAALVPIATAFNRDPSVAERLGRDFVASATDAAAGYATIGALFDALGDPGRARPAWQAAVDASPEPIFVRGLAESAARGGDGPAALVFATQAAAAWGDPAVVWVAVASALVDAGQHVDGLYAARTTLDLAGPEVLPRALDVAVVASRALGRQAQADALLVQRTQLAPRTRTEDADARAALLAHREQPTAATTARLWVASRAQPRDVELRAALIEALDADDARRATVTAELVVLAGDPDPNRALAAVAALRR